MVRIKGLASGMKEITFKNQRGFSLIEVLIATIVLAMVLLLVVNGSTTNSLRAKRIPLYNDVTYLMQKKLTEIEGFYKNRLQELPTNPTSGEFEDPLYKDFSFTWEAQRLKMPDMGRLLIETEGGADEMTLTLLETMKNYFEQSVFEIRLTILYKKFKFPISTYLVDYSRTLELPNLNPASLQGFGGRGQ